MAQVRVISRAEARDGRAAELRILLRRMVAPTRAEDGCVYFELLESNVPNLFYFDELWESREYLQAHAASRHFAEIFGTAKELLAVPLEVNLLVEVQ
jgi:quinol monooxygenase YgiN